MNHGPATPTSPRPSGHSRGFSFKSNHSSDSKNHSEPLVESPRERDRRSNLWNGNTKANPNAALAEQQPGERNVQEQSTLSNLRDMMHRDQYGQPIADPDLSNPTRSRFERPLDTIRSFEKAIDSGYKRRSSFAKQESEQQYDQSNQYASRRSSYFGAFEGPNNGHRSNGNGNGYYGQQRPDSAYMNGGGRQPPRHNRMQTDPGYHSYAQPQSRSFPQHSYQQSYDTGHTGGSDSTGPWGNSTDPSSENSSLDRGMVKPPTPGMDNYALHSGPIMEEQGYYDDEYAQQYAQQQYAQQQQSYNGYSGHDGYSHASVPRRAPIPLGGNGGVPSSTQLPPTTRPGAEKKQQRKSWLKRTFSKG